MANAVEIRIGADAKQAIGELKQLGGAFGTLDKAVKIASNPLVLAGAALTSLGVAVGAMATAAINAQDEIAKMSARTGIAVETLSALKVGGELADASLESLSTAVAKMSRVIIEADKGSTKAQATLGAFGISSRDAAGDVISTESALRKAADALSSMQDGIEKSALAQDLFGRGAMDLIPLLNDGAAGLDAMTQRARDLGLAMNEVGTQNAERFNDTLTGIKQTLMGMVNTAVDFWLPTMNTVAETIEFLAGGGQAALDRQNAARKGIQSSIDPLEDMDGALAEAGEELSRWIAANGKVPVVLKDVADATKGAASAERERAAAIASVQRAQEEQQRFESAMVSALIGGIAQQQLEDDNRAAYEIDVAQRKADAVLAVERAMFEESRMLREADAENARRLADAQSSTAAAMFDSIGQLAGTAYDLLGKAAESGGHRAKAAMKALFIVSKAASLAGAVVNVAQSVTSAAAVQPYPVGLALSIGAGVAGAAQIATIAATTIQGVADAGLPPGALRAAGLGQHTVLAVRNDEMVLGPRDTSEVSEMLALQRRQMEAGQQSANQSPVVVAVEMDGRRLTRALAPHETRAIEDGYDPRRNVRFGVG